MNQNGLSRREWFERFGEEGRGGGAEEEDVEDEKEKESPNTSTPGDSTSTPPTSSPPQSIGNLPPHPISFSLHFTFVSHYLPSIVALWAIYSLLRCKNYGDNTMLMYKPQLI